MRLLTRPERSRLSAKWREVGTELSDSGTIVARDPETKLALAILLDGSPANEVRFQVLSPERENLSAGLPLGRICWGYFHTLSGDRAFPLECFAAGNFHEGFGPVRMSDALVGHITRLGKLAYPPIPGKAIEESHEGLTVWRPLEPDDVVFYLHVRTGKQAHRERLLDAQPFSEGFGSVRLPDGSANFLDHNFELCWQRYSRRNNLMEAGSFHFGKAPVRLWNELWCYMTNRFVLGPKRYRVASEFRPDGTAVATDLDGNIRIIDLDENIVSVPPSR